MLSPKELHLRAALFHAIREFFQQSQFLEVDTPVRLPAIIPEMHIQPIPTEEWYLQTSPELYMKRLLAAGCPKIFQLCHCFRKEERGRNHLEEFIMLEWYRLDADYFSLMRDCEELLAYIANSIVFSEFSADNHEITASRKRIQQIFQNTSLQISVTEAFHKWSPVPLKTALEGDIFDEILVEHIEPKLGINQPTFLYDYPTVMAALSRKKAEDQNIAERFELYVAGLELANAFSELTDPEEQRARFLADLAAIESQTGRKQEMPEKFVRDLEKIDRAAGIALGVDRLFMLVLGKETVHDAVTFSVDDM